MKENPTFSQKTACGESAAVWRSVTVHWMISAFIDEGPDSLSSDRYSERSICEQWNVAETKERHSSKAAVRVCVETVVSLF